MSTPLSTVNSSRQSGEYSIHSTEDTKKQQKITATVSNEKTEINAKPVVKNRAVSSEPELSYTQDMDKETEKRFFRTNGICAKP